MVTGTCACSCSISAILFGAILATKYSFSDDTCDVPVEGYEYDFVDRRKDGTVCPVYSCGQSVGMRGVRLVSG